MPDSAGAAAFFLSFFDCKAVSEDRIGLRTLTSATAAAGAATGAAATGAAATTGAATGAGVAGLGVGALDDPVCDVMSLGCV